MGAKMKKLFESFRSFVNENTADQLMQKARIWRMPDFSLDPREVGDSYWALLQEVIPALTGLIKMVKGDTQKIKAINNYIAELSAVQERSKTMDVSDVVMSAARVIPSGRGIDSLAATPLGQELGLGAESLGLPADFDEPDDL